MKRENLFYLICIFTVIAVRVGVFFFPANKIILVGTVIHHFWIGLAIILLVSLFFRKIWALRTIVLPVGLGLFSDEFFYMILGAGPVFPNYWSWYSLGGAALCCIFVFAFKKKIAGKFKRKGSLT